MTERHQNSAVSQASRLSVAEGQARFALTLLISLSMLLAAAPRAFAEDWPTYNHDFARSGVTGEQLPDQLREVWVHRSPHPPQVAWPGPAKWDAYNKVYNLKDRTNFDAAFPVVVAGDRAYFGSNVDDKIYCLDAATGKEQWVYFTEGPVRLAPTISDGKVYVGSDDGQVYCLDASTGELLWKHRLGPVDRRVVGNGRMISLWPVRSSVIVMDDIAYACAGVFPSETVYLCAMNATTGEAIWRTSIHDLPAQGYLLASATRLYVTTGRDAPVVFNREDGSRIFQVAGGGGGTYALLTGDTLIYGPGKTGHMSIHKENQPDQLATFAGNHMIVAEAMSYLQTDKSLTALDRAAFLALLDERRDADRQLAALAQAARKHEDADADKVRVLRERMTRLSTRIDELTQQMNACYKWEVDTDHTGAIILAGGTLYAGGRDSVLAIDAATGRELWRGEVEGNAMSLTVANGRLYVSTDRGVIHCFAGGKD